MNSKPQPLWANSVFRASASCSKILNDKKCIFNAMRYGMIL